MIQVDNRGQAIVVNDEGSRWTKSTSGRQIRANRRNGRLSKGPVTDDGKKRSSRNSTKHGALASGYVPIDRGPFSEDSQAFYQKLGAIVDSLDPQNEMERCLAMQIGGNTMRHGRLNLFETATYESTAHQVQNELRGVENEGTLDELAGWARGLHYYLLGVEQSEPVPYMNYAALMRAKGPHPGQEIKNLWDDKHHPTSDEEWEKAFRHLLRVLWPTREHARAWAYQLSKSLDEDWVAAEGREKEIVADRILDGPFDRITRYGGRITNDTIRLLSAYEKLKSGPLPRRGSNEPNPDEA